MFGFLSIDWEKIFFPVQLVAKFSRVRCYLCKAMICFTKLVNLILSCLCQAFAISSDIKNDLLNLQKYLLVGETISSSSTKVAKEMQNKYQKKNRSPIKLRLGNFENINRGWVKFCSHIPTGDYVEGINEGPKDKWKW